jgi:hypothetical protein
LEILLKELERTEIRRVHNEDQHVNESPIDSKLSGKAVKSSPPYTKSCGVGGITTTSSNPPILQDPALWKVNE